MNLIVNPIVSTSNAHSLLELAKTMDVPSLKIILVTETWPPEINGVANSVNQLAKGLVNAGNHIVLVRPRPNAFVTSCVQEEVFVSAHTIPNYTDMQFGHASVLRLVKLFKKHKADVVHIVTEGPLGLAALIAARICRLPISSGYHSQFDDFSAHLGYEKLVKPITTYLNWFHNRCDLTCVPSQKSYNQLLHAGVDNVHIVGRGVDTEQFHPKHRSDKLRQSWGADADTTVVMYVGRISPEKNIALTAQSFLALKKAQPKRLFKLVIVGNGPTYDKIKTEVKLVVADAIFTGAKTGHDLSEYYASGDVFVFASEVETFGNVVTEAMASGQAIIAYHDAAAARFVTKQSGWTVEKSNKNAFVQAVKSIPELSELHQKGQYGHIQMQQMGWNIAVKQFYQGFIKAITKKKRKKHKQYNEQFNNILSDNWV